MHDAISVEHAGAPAVAIMTDAFVSGATLMATALNHTGYPFAVIEHPIASATDEALRNRARAAMIQATHILELPRSEPLTDH